MPEGAAGTGISSRDKKKLPRQKWQNSYGYETTQLPKPFAAQSAKGNSRTRRQDPRALPPEDGPREVSKGDGFLTMPHAAYTASCLRGKVEPNRKSPAAARSLGGS